MEGVFLALGSNLGDREALLNQAVELLRDIGEVVAVSTFIETVGVCDTPQPPYLNAALHLHTKRAPYPLLYATQAIEKSLGRRSKSDKAPRLIDIDILLYGDLIVQASELQIPHTQLPFRTFYLDPLYQLCPDRLHPVLKESIDTLYHRIHA